uniref:BMC domain-containing protein n=1 Tax=Bellilinea caldifistulae TaxID=360411 RepID=A0A7C4L045_9CHLR
MNKALGLIETIGLVAAIEAADAAVKAANVVLLGYDSARAGKITIKLAGDVGAVQAAVAAGVAAASRVGTVFGSLVIPRPHEEIDPLIRQTFHGPVAPKTRPPTSRQPMKEIEQAAPEKEIPAQEIPSSAEETAEPTHPEAEIEDTATQESGEPLQPPKRCIAITKTGTPCKLPARPGSDYCVFHQKLAGKTAGQPMPE